LSLSNVWPARRAGSDADQPRAGLGAGLRRNAAQDQVLVDRVAHPATDLARQTPR